MSNGQSEILSEIDQGSMLNFAINGDYLTALEAESGLWIGLGESASTFTANTYEFFGEMSAKISLTLEGHWAWFPVADAGELQNAIALNTSEAGGFTLTDEGEGLISIQNEFSPPPPFYQVVNRDPCPFPYLSYGFDRPLLNLFTIEVVG